MAYDGKVMRRAMARWDGEKQRRKAEFARRQEEVFAQSPRLREIDRELRDTVSGVIAAALRQGEDPLPAIRRLRDENLELQRERAELLVGMGYPMDYLEETPACDKCDDTGYCGQKVCQCLQRFYNEEQIKELSKMLDLGSQRFENFSFDWYSGAIDSEVGISSRELMEKNFDLCQDYAHQFSKSSENLLLFGDPGLGKTFLSACIARVVSENGFSVVYDTAGHIFSRMEAEKFRRDEDEAENDVARYENCDLLIMDDLGSEMHTSFVQSALYQLVNGRLMAGKKTIINTNLQMEDIAARYGAAIASRLEGEYQMLPFFGEDIRRLKRERG